MTSYSNVIQIFSFSRVPQNASVYFSRDFFGQSKSRVICLRIKIVQGKEQGKLIQNSNKFYTKNVVYKEDFEPCCQQVMRKQGYHTRYFDF